jgi:hypothetical protein
VAPFNLKGLINTILDTKHASRFEGIDGFLAHHPNFNNSDPSLLENIAGGVLRIKVHPTPIRPKEIKNETPKNILWLPNKNHQSDSPGFWEDHLLFRQLDRLINKRPRKGNVI